MDQATTTNRRPRGADPPHETIPRPLTEDVGWLLARTTHALGSRLVDDLAPLGLSPRAYAVLAAAARAAADGAPRSQLALARAVGVDKSTMVVTLDELERAGLVARRPDPRDRRARVVEPTAAGRGLLERAEGVVRALEAEVLGDLAAEELAALLEMLNRLVAGRLSATVEGGSCL